MISTYIINHYVLIFIISLLVADYPLSLALNHSPHTFTIAFRAAAARPALVAKFQEERGVATGIAGRERIRIGFIVVSKCQYHGV